MVGGVRPTLRDETAKDGAPGLFWLVERVEGAKFLSFAAAGGPLGFDFYWVRFAGGVVVEAAPAVVFGFRDQAAGDRVAVDVLELFGELLWA